MNKLEAQFQGKWTAFIRKQGFGGLKKYFNDLSFPYELKASKGKTVPFSKFQDQQIPSLERAWKGCHGYKMTDASLGLKPYDGTLYCHAPAQVGIMFNMPENKSECYFIHIKDILKIKTKQKSITLDDAKKYGIRIDL